MDETGVVYSHFPNSFICCATIDGNSLRNSEFFFRTKDVEHVWFYIEALKLISGLDVPVIGRIGFVITRPKWNSCRSGT